MAVDLSRTVKATVPIDHLLTLLPLHPYTSPAWSCDPFTIEDVLACPVDEPADCDTWDGSSTARHVAHIAYLARAWPNDGTAAPELLVYQGVSLCDGWHRLAAAVARGDKALVVELSGDFDEAARLGLGASEVGR